MASIAIIGSPSHNSAGQVLSPLFTEEKNRCFENEYILQKWYLQDSSTSMYMTSELGQTDRGGQKKKLDRAS